MQEKKRVLSLEARVKVNKLVDEQGAITVTASTASRTLLMALAQHPEGAWLLPSNWQMLQSDGPARP